MDKSKLKALIGKSHELKAKILLGKKGLTEDAVKEIERRLEKHGLVKIKLLQSFEGETKETSEKIVQKTKAELVQAIGGTIVLFKEMKKKVFQKNSGNEKKQGKEIRYKERKQYSEKNKGRKRRKRTQHGKR